MLLAPPIKLLTLLSLHKLLSVDGPGWIVLLRLLWLVIDYLDRRAKKALVAGWRPFSEGGSPMEQENFSLPIHGIWDLAWKTLKE